MNGVEALCKCRSNNADHTLTYIIKNYLYMPNNIDYKCGDWSWAKTDTCEFTFYIAKPKKWRVKIYYMPTYYCDFRIKVDHLSGL